MLMLFEGRELIVIDFYAPLVSSAYSQGGKLGMSSSCHERC